MTNLISSFYDLANSIKLKMVSFVLFFSSQSTHNAQ